MSYNIQSLIIEIIMANKDDNVVKIEDLYKLESRAFVVENTIIQINQTLIEIKQDLKDFRKEIKNEFIRIETKFDNEFKDIRKETQSNFKWIIGSIGGFALTVIGTLLTIIFKLHLNQ
jgi:predicted PurR-regulated permease PerM